MYCDVEEAAAATKDAGERSALSVYTNLALLCAQEFLSVTVLLGVCALEYEAERFKDTALFAEITSK